MQHETPTKKTSKMFNSPRVATAVAVVATVTALAGPVSASAHIGSAGCAPWVCGSNHNEALATTPV